MMKQDMKLLVADHYRACVIFKLNIFFQKLSPSKQCERTYCSLDTVSDAAFSFNPCFLSSYYSVVGTSFSDLCKFNIPLLSPRFGSYLKVNVLPCLFDCLSSFLSCVSCSSNRTVRSPCQIQLSSCSCEFYRLNLVVCLLLQA